MGYIKVYVRIQVARPRQVRRQKRDERHVAPVGQTREIVGEKCVREHVEPPLLGIAVGLGA